MASHTAAARGRRDTVAATTASTRHARTIQGALPIVAKAIGRRLDVQVRIGGSEARTDGRTICLPSLPFEDPDVETLAFGFLEHEAAHVRYSEPVEAQTELHHRLCNAIEDVRVERRLGDEYPGFAHTLKALVGKLVETDYLKPPLETDSPVTKLGRYLLYRLRADVLEQEAIRTYASRAEKLFRQAFPRGACVRIASVMGRVPTLKSSQEALDLAREILDIIKEESEEPPPQPPAAPEAATGEPQSSGTGLTPGDSGSESGAEAAQREKLRQVLDASPADLGEDLRQTMGAALQEKAAEVASASETAGVGRAQTPLQEPPLDPAVALAEVKEATIALRTRIRSFVESARRSGRAYGRQGARAEPRRFVRAMLGDPRVFKKKRTREDVNTAVVLLLDRSGSMATDQRIIVAAQSTLAAATALEAIPRVAVAAGVFPACETDVELLTSFSDSVRRTAHRYKAVEPEGGTPLLPAMLWAADELIARREPRKMLVVVTDGQPAAFGACQDVITRCWRGGIEVYGIGIRVPDISSLFPVSRAIDTLEELAPAMFGVLQEALSGRVIN